MASIAEGGSAPAPSPEAVREQLAQILASPTFQASHCSSAFLRYVVDHALEGRLDLLRERQIGIEILGRDPSYDTSEDSSVRVRATEVRKRLLQYYAGHEDELQIHLPRGTYVPEFIAPTAPTTYATRHPPETAHGFSLWRRQMLPWLLVASVVVSALVAFRGTWLAPSNKTALDQFWAPVLSSGQKQVVLSVGRHPVYDIAWKTREDYFKTHPYPDGPPPFSLPRDPDLVLHGSDLLPQQGLFVGVGVADAVRAFTSFLAVHGKTCYMRSGTTLTFEELHAHPAILIGALSNYWSMHFTRDLRFHFAESAPEGDGVILDRQNPTKMFVSRVELPGSESRQIDYGLVCRLRTESAEPVIIAAGLLQWGVQAAADVLTDPSRFAAAVRHAPPDWQRKNIQILVRVDVVNTTVGSPEVIDTHFW